MILLALLGCATIGLHYAPLQYPLEPPDPAAAAGIERWIAHAFDRGRTISSAATGPVSTPAQLAPQERLAVAVCGYRRDRGGEVDLWLEGPDSRIPVTVWVEPDGDMRVASGAPGPAAEPPTPASPEALLDAGALARVSVRNGPDSSWSKAELVQLRDALSLLDPVARGLVSGLVVERRQRSPRAPVRELAWYDSRSSPPVLMVFDAAFEGVNAFVGPVTAPRPTGLLTLLHELGHAIADRPHAAAWDAMLRTADAPRERWRAARREYRGLGRRGPVVDAYLQVWGGRGPTRYGDRNAHESFAESFALFHADPDALLRADPDVYTWFAAGEPSRTATGGTSADTASDVR
ncbi:MAG: hypothetical protein ACI8PZ_000278 [Myxococcota bacterium]